MFYVLKVYWLFIPVVVMYAKKWFLKRRLDTNLYQVLIDIKHTRDWQLGLKKNLQDSTVKPIILKAQKMTISVKDLFNKCE